MTTTGYSLTDQFVHEISKNVVGRQDIVKVMLASLLSQGHVLLEGNPGLGKTRLAKAFSQSIGGEFRRVQMTPDTLPADIIGSLVYDQKGNSFQVRKGPIFGNVILVDELNRATPKAQSALLESMQERQVTIETQTIGLNEPFIVIATQVAFGTAGTYPLSEVQSDRFAFSVQMSYLSREEEKEVMARIDSIESGSNEQILNLDEINTNIRNAKKIYVSDLVQEYIVSLMYYLRNSPNVKSAPSTRASIALYKGARAIAFLDGKEYVIPDYVKFLAPYVFQHRIFLKPEAMTEDITPGKLIAEMLDTVPVPKGEASSS